MSQDSFEELIEEITVSFPYLLPVHIKEIAEKFYVRLHRLKELEGLLDVLGGPAECLLCRQRAEKYPVQHLHGCGVGRLLSTRQ